jgi:hypothetical protein
MVLTDLTCAEPVQSARRIVFSPVPYVYVRNASSTASFRRLPVVACGLRIVGAARCHRDPPPAGAHTRRLRSTPPIPSPPAGFCTHAGSHIMAQKMMLIETDSLASDSRLVFVDNYDVYTRVVRRREASCSRARSHVCVCVCATAPGRPRPLIGAQWCPLFVRTICCRSTFHFSYGRRIHPWVFGFLSAVDAFRKVIDSAVAFNGRSNRSESSTQLMEVGFCLN